MNISISEEM